MKQIPKVIHYCWFGGNPLPEDAIRCINSWKVFCPNYEIKEWNESNFDLNSCDYVKEAASVGKWAFVSDYVRYKVLYEYGGLYFDTDVELIKPLDDIVARSNFIGVEQPVNSSKSQNYLINPGLGIGCKAGNQIVKAILDVYATEHYILADGSASKKTVLNYTSEVFEQFGFNYQNEIQQIEDWIVYPTVFFCPMSYSTGEVVITEDTKSIHWYSMSWKTSYEKFMKSWERSLKRLMGEKMGGMFYRVLSLPVRVPHKMLVSLRKGFK